MAISQALVAPENIGGRIAAALEATGGIGEDEALQIIAAGPARGLLPVRSLVMSGRVSIEMLERASWWHKGVEILDFDPTKLVPAVVDTLPLHVCTAARAIVVSVDDDKTSVIAVTDAADIEAMDSIRQAMAMRPFRTVVADVSTIDEAVRRYQTRTLVGDLAAPTAAPAAVRASVTDEGDDSQAGKLLSGILQYAIQAQGSDIRVECRPGRAIIRYRLDSVLHEYDTFDPDLGRQLVGRIKVLAKIDSGQFLLPQDGQMQFQIGGRSVDIRVATSPTVWETEDVVLRILDRPQGVIKLSDLGFEPSAQQAIYKLVDRPHGLVLVTGPTGSGKTTTLYSLLTRVATPDRAVLTIEDPVEYRIPEIHQVQVNEDAGRSFAVVLRSFLRFDPDIIMVGEVRDQPTLKTALEASLTGHLVLATIHTNDAPSTPLRLIEMGADPFLVASALSGVVAQRLARKLCPKCKVPAQAPPELAEWVANGPARVFEAKEGGCPSCYRAGYRGRTALHEVLAATDEIGKAIVDHELTGAITKLALEAGMVSLKASGMAKVAAGETSFAEVLRVTA
jgi:type IV pilus assembly protein PilB